MQVLHQPSCVLNYEVDALADDEPFRLPTSHLTGWFSDYPEAGSNMYLLAPDQVYKVRVLASSLWVPEVRRWEPERFIIGEGINFIVEDTTRLMQNLHRANVIAEQVGIRLYKE